MSTVKKFAEITAERLEALVKATSRHITVAVIHCSAEPEGRDTKVEDIERMHKARGFNEIGYNLVIELDGTVRKGRNWNKIPAHVKGNNSKSLGICYIGGMDKDYKEAKDTRTEEQKASLQWVVFALANYFQDHKNGIELEFKGHRDFSPDLNGDGIIDEFEWIKICPSFDVEEWLNEINFYGTQE